jgi:hypothetical protein
MATEVCGRGVPLDHGGQEAERERKELGKTFKDPPPVTYFLQLDSTS